ncbi:DMT family transporter [Streptomyces hesseae]|uniref:DMT family transporter n=1 Tax=Streptomyces hesseae TaxID=3075519 RepID=A0ABU2SXW6_9ACTN|nr:DMT family transporter [Streptomyces sp. DSM 40473]MDT0453214.1 DMT family transporter [Streptomyces sp. DSM 40473]
MAAKSRFSNPYALLLMTMLLWGSSFSSSKAVVEHVPHSVGALLRFGGGALALLLAVALFGNREQRVPARAGWLAAAAGVLGVFAYNGFFFWGLSLAPSLDAGILIPVMSPVLTSSFLLLTGKEKPDWARVTGLALGLTGAVIFFLGAGGSGGGGSSRLLGDALFLLSAVCWASYTLAGPRVLAGIEPLKATTYATCAGAVLLAVLAAPDLPKVEWSELPASVWLNSAFLAIGAAAVANLLYYRGVGAVGPAKASLMMFNVPIVNTLCATVLLGESFGWIQGTGALVLVLGAVIAVTRGKLPRRAAGPDARARAEEEAKAGSGSTLSPAPAEGS